MPFLARLLLGRGQITREQLVQAIEHQVVYGGRLGTSLIELGFVPEKEISEALATKYGIPTIEVKDEEIEKKLVSEIGKEKLERYKVFPHSVQSKTLKLLMVDPSDHVAKAAISYGTSYIIRPYVIPEYRMLDLLERYCGVAPQWRYEDRSEGYVDKALRSGAGRPTDAQPPAPEPLPVKEALARLERAKTRDEVIALALSVLQNFCPRVIFYIVRKNYILGWDCVGPGVDRRLIRSHIFPLTEPSIFQTVHENPGPYMGPLPRTAANDLLRKSIEKRTGNMLVLPVSLGGKIVNLIYCDAGPRGDVSAEMKDILLFTSRMPEAYLRIIQKRIKEQEEARE
ncbi:MAG: hypothetical protein AB1405_13600 [Bdellovibrionota bacterium]